MGDTSGIVKEAIIGEEGKVTTVTETELVEVVKTSKLYTAEYPYNGYCEVKNDEGETKYYVAYEGKVKAGIDVSKIIVSLDEETNTIKIMLPEVEVENPTVDAGTLEYIFMDKKYDTETVAQEAYKMALADLESKVQDDENIINAATDSAKTAEKAFVEPWVNQADSSKIYTVKVIANGEEK